MKFKMILFIKSVNWPDLMPKAYNPSYSVWIIVSGQPQKNKGRHPFQPIKLGMVADTCHLSQVEIINRRITVLAGLCIRESISRK
jgi:hypothetical protein